MENMQVIINKGNLRTALEWQKELEKYINNHKSEYDVLQLVSDKIDKESLNDAIIGKLKKIEYIDISIKFSNDK